MNSWETIGQMPAQCGSMNSSAAACPLKLAGDSVRPCWPVRVQPGARPSRDQGEPHQVSERGRDTGRQSRRSQRRELILVLADPYGQVGERGRQHHAGGWRR